jgi:3-carboxy-cis,cis-muconate cycloisomerase
MTELLAGFLGPLLIDDETARMIGTDADIRAMREFEIALALSEADHELIAEPAANRIAEAGADFAPDRDQLAIGALRDGVVPADFVKQMRAHIGAPASDSLHFGATSQDVIDTAFALKLKPLFDLYETRLAAISKWLGSLLADFGNRDLMGRTRMQAAIPISVANRLAVWKGLVDRALDDLPMIRERVLVVSLAGAAGSSEKFGDRIDAVRISLARRLGLGVPTYVPHSARDRIADLGNWLSKVTGAFGKIGQDVALMAQNEMAEIALSGGGGSSAMAHKQNPVRAEVLVALARFNAVQLSGLHQSLVHEQERSGAAWTLEWMILPQMLNATGISLVHADAMLASIKRIGRAD